MMDIQIATINDLPSICELADQVSATHYREMPDVFVNPEEIKGSAAFWSDRIHAENSTFLVARVDHTVVGFITARITGKTDIPFLKNRKICHIGTIVVSDEYQSRGIGGKLMHATENWASQQGAVEVRLEVMEFNQDAQSFYNNKGYAGSSRIMKKILV